MTRLAFPVAAPAISLCRAALTVRAPAALPGFSKGKAVTDLIIG